MGDTIERYDMGVRVRVGEKKIISSYCNVIKPFRMKAAEERSE